MHQHSFADIAAELIQNFATTRPMRANTLILSIYGDTIDPFGGVLWLGSLIKLVAPLGIGSRLARTSVFRLSEKGVLQSQQVGRRSYYQLTDRGFRQMQSASRRIYTSHAPVWSGEWRIVMTSLGVLNTEQRDALNKELRWLGFSCLARGVYIHPTADMQTVRRMLDDRSISDQVVTLYASPEDGKHQLIQSQFDVQAMDATYKVFADTFQPILTAVRQEKKLGSAPDPQLSFLVRTLLIHKYRHILLNEPELPSELLAADAMPHQARQITRQLYLCLAEQADAYFLDAVQSDNTLVAPSKQYHQRYDDGIHNKKGVETAKQPIQLAESITE